MKPGWLTLALGVGLVIPLQQAMNAKMRTFVVNPMYASLVNFFVGAAFGVIVAALMSASGEPGNWRRATEAPWWAGWPRHRFGCLGDAGTRGIEGWVSSP